MSLTKYNAKRKFDETSEPRGKAAHKEGKLIFVVQRHHASHLHYDFRLELNGVLKSWAVPKGPSLNPKDKRLAMMVEDHPKDYATFQGDIPEGNYGAGHVDVWDHGTYIPVDEHGGEITPRKFAAGLAAGSIKFALKGKLLKGEFALVRLKKDEKSWLLIKHRDEYATDDDYNSEDFAKKSSLAYTRERREKSAGKTKAPAKPFRIKDSALSGAKKLTDYIRPMLTKLHDEAFDDPEWIFEVKWDGYRAIAEVKKGEARLYSRNGLSFKDAYSGVYDELSKIKKDVVLDGEIVALDKNGKPKFQLLQQYLQERNVPLCYYVFDCLYVNGKSVEKKTLLERKELLRSLLPLSDIIVYSDHIVGKGKSFFKEVGKKGLEGMIAKRAESTYHEGVRSSDWLKVKHMLTGEAVIAGYTEARGSRKHFGALVLGVYRKGKLTYIGHTGTGFKASDLTDLYGKMQALKTERSPFAGDVPVNAPVTWIKPKLVCSLKYTEVTGAGTRRHPVYMGLRADKDAKDVHDEVKG